jgi:hypothetical protein
MAYDFPDAPTAGQEFDTGDAIYVYNNGAWDLKSAGAQDFVLKAGDTMTGALTVQAAPGQGAVKLVPSGSATNGGYVEWTNPDDTRKAYLGYRDPTTLELELASATAFSIKNGELQLKGGGVSAPSYIRTMEGGAFAWNNTDNAQFQTFMHCGAIQLQVKKGGNNDGQFQVFTSNGGYSDLYVFYTTVASGGPGIVVHGNVSAASMTDRTLLADPSLVEFAEGEGSERGINLGRALLHALAEIKALKAKVK